ncbi:MAG TPA: hypothetical protein VF411_00810 [Bacteroidia bacterium]
MKTIKKIAKLLCINKLLLLVSCLQVGISSLKASAPIMLLLNTKKFESGWIRNMI